MPSQRVLRWKPARRALGDARAKRARNVVAAIIPDEDDLGYPVLLALCHVVKPARSALGDARAKRAQSSSTYLNK